MRGARAHKFRARFVIIQTNTSRPARRNLDGEPPLNAARNHWLISENILMQSQRRKLLAANWKMHGDTAAVDAWCAAVSARLIAKRLELDTVLCPPAILIPSARSAIVAASESADSPLELGAQDSGVAIEGAYTGQISARMCKSAGCKYVILGHSERRQIQREDDVEIAHKMQTALEEGLHTIVCVGETDAQRKQGRAEQAVGAQVQMALDYLNVASFYGQFNLAYEPVWAIGSGVSATPAQAQSMHRFIRGKIAERDARTAAACRILYGGSMNPNNAEALLREADIDGGLLGGAGLVAADFYSICQIAAGI